MQRQQTIIVGIVAFVIMWLGAAEAQNKGTARVSAALWQKMVTKGTVRVIVGLNEPIQPEGELGDDEKVKKQRNRIAKAHDKVVDEMMGTHHTVIHRLKTIPVMVMEVSPDALAALERSQSVKGVAEDLSGDLNLYESAPLVKADKAWNEEGYDGSGMTIAILDTGVDKSHPFLKGKIVDEACFGSCPNGQNSQKGPGAAVPCTYSADCLHGTHVAGIAAGKNGTATVIHTVNGKSVIEPVTFSGVARGANIMAVQTYHPNSGGAQFYFGDLFRALDYVIEKSAFFNIASVNFSGGVHEIGFDSRCDFEPAPGEPIQTASLTTATLKTAIDHLRSMGIPTVIASGNDAFTNKIEYPACISSAVSVGATTKQDTIWLACKDPKDPHNCVDPLHGSNSASFLSLLAPGADILSSIPGDGFASLTGTSMAAPHVAGAWALMKQKDQDVGVDKVLELFRTTGNQLHDGRNTVVTARIDVLQALNALTVPHSAKAVVQQSDGKILVAGLVYNGANKVALLARFDASGNLDKTFNSRGWVSDVFGPSDNVFNAVAIQPDGKILVAGSAYNGSGNVAILARYDASGNQDSTFGFTETRPFVARGYIAAAFGPSGENAFRAVALQKDGKILVAGNAYNGSGQIAIVARYDSAGKKDPSFGPLGRGYIAEAFGPDGNVFRAMRLQNDKILVAGSTYNGSGNVAILARYDAFGNRDSTFGFTQTPPFVARGFVSVPFGSSDNALTALALQDGKILVAGSYSNGGSYGDVLARFDDAGNLDSSFNGRGWVAESFGPGSNVLNAVAVQSDGKILVAGSSFNGSGYVDILARYTTAGQRDSSFHSPRWYVALAPESGNNAFNALVLQSADGKILAVGDGADQTVSVVTRFDQYGNLDSTFGTNGVSELR